MSKMQSYVSTQLGTVGFVLCNARLAYRLRRDLWGAQLHVNVSGPDSRKYLGMLAAEESIALFTFEGEGLQGFGAAFNIKRLEERVNIMYGIDIKITVVNSLMEPVSVQHGHDPQAHAVRVRDEKLEKLRKLAVQIPPIHDCSLQREILDARVELERLGESREAATV